jgi:hypothetical protein
MQCFLGKIISGHLQGFDGMATDAPSMTRVNTLSSSSSADALLGIILMVKHASISVFSALQTMVNWGELEGVQS